MWEFFSKLYTQFTKISNRYVKYAYLGMLLVAILVIDNSFGIRRHWYTMNRLEELKKITKIEKNARFDSLQIIKIGEIKDEILNRHHFFDYFSFESKNTEINPSNPHKNRVQAILKDKDSKDIWILFLSSMGVYALLGTLILIVYVSYNLKKKGFLKTISIGFTSFTICWIFGFGLLFAEDLFIPKIQDSTWFWNFLLNLIIQMCSFYIFTKFLTQINKKQNP